MQLSAAEVETLMRQLLSGQNEQIKQATSSLKAFSKQPQCLALLFNILTSHGDRNLRQLSTVLLKQNLVKHYEDLAGPDKEYIRAALLQRFDLEESTQVKSGIARLMGQIVSIVGIGSWPELERVFTANVEKADTKVALILLKNLLTKIKPAPVIIEFIMKALRHEALAGEALECISAYTDSDDFN
jgi:hypothetical protein